MNLEKIMLMKKNSHKRLCTARCYLYEMSRRNKSIETESRLLVAPGLEGQGEEDSK